MSGIKAERERFRTQVAPPLAEKFGRWLRSFQPGTPLSRRFVFLHDDSRLVVLAGGQERLHDVGRALAFGLAWNGDRDLVLVLPDGKAGPTLDRLAFLRPGVRVFTHDGRTVSEAVIPARHQVLASYTDPLELSQKDLGDRAAWVTSLVEWADAHQHLSASHRPSYLAWHSDGRLVLRIQVAHQALRVSAGVHASTPSSKYTPLVTVMVSGPLAVSDLASLKSTAELAIAGRHGGDDSDHLEHLLQATLGARPHLLGLLPNPVGAPQQFFRELPCRRPGAARNYIDLAGVDKYGTFHVVETKIGGDEMLVLQGLDYYIWALAHRDALATHLSLPELRIALDFVVAAKPGEKPIGPYTVPQLDSLDGSISWCVKTVEGWQGGKFEVTSHGRRALPPPGVGPTPVMGPRYASRVHDHLISLAGPLQANKVSMVQVGGSIHPAARHVWDDLEARSALHKWASHVRSSQAFAINVFGPLGVQGSARLLEQFFGPIKSADAPVFEFEDVADRLSESTAKRPHRTQVDVLLRGTGTDGRNVALMVEVKLSEDDFGYCSAYENAANDRIDVCRQPGAFGGDPVGCFQLRNHGTGAQRTYDQYLPQAAQTGCGCSFRRSISQPMRNLALAGVLAADGFDVKFALCAPAAHQGMWRRWDVVGGVFGDDQLIDLPAEQVVAMHHDAQVAAWLVQRYQLAEPVQPRVAASREWATWAMVAELTSRYECEFRVIETHPGGGQYDCISLYDARSASSVADLNRAGRIHAMGADGLQPIDHLWEFCRRAGPGMAADRLARCLGVALRPQPVDVPWREFASLVKSALEQGSSFAWLNGMLDTSGEQGGVRRHLYEATGLPLPPDNDSDSFPDHPSYADWFLVDASEVVIAQRSVP